MMCHLHILVGVLLSVGKGLSYHLEIWWQQHIFKLRKARKSPILTLEGNFKKQQPCVYNVSVGTDFCLYCSHSSLAVFLEAFHIYAKSQHVGEIFHFQDVGFALD